MILFRLIEKLCDRYREVIVIGDFNLYSCPVNISNYYECFVSYCEFTQSNAVPNCSGRQLDLVLSTGFSEELSVVAADEPLVPVDAQHPPLAVSVRLAPAPPALAPFPPVDDGRSSAHSIRPWWNFYKADYQMLYSMLTSTDWGTMYDKHDLEEVLNVFYDKINNILDKCVPQKKLNHRKSRYIYPEWYTRDIIKDIQIKARLHKKFKETKLDSDYDTFAKYRARIKKSIENAHKEHKSKIQSQFAKDPKSFWQYIRSKRSRLNRQSIVKDGQYLTDHECARQLADFFKSVYSKEPPRLDARVAAAAAKPTSVRVHIETLSLQDVKDALVNLKPKRSSGPDGIPGVSV